MRINSTRGAKASATAKSDTQEATEVAVPSSRSKVTAATASPLVSKVTAGDAAVKEKITLGSLLKPIIISGKKMPRANMRFVRGYFDETHNMDVTILEGDLIDFLRGDEKTGYVRGAQKITYTYDCSERLEEDLLPENGATPMSILTEYRTWRCAREIFCSRLRDYLAAVEADEEKRQAEDDALWDTFRGTAASPEEPAKP